MHASWELLQAGDFAAARTELAEAARDASPGRDVLHNYAACCYKLGDFAEPVA